MNNLLVFLGKIPGEMYRIVKNKPSLLSQILLLTPIVALFNRAVYTYFLRHVELFNQALFLLLFMMIAYFIFSLCVEQVNNLLEEAFKDVIVKKIPREFKELKNTIEYLRRKCFLEETISLSRVGKYVLPTILSYYVLLAFLILFLDRFLSWLLTSSNVIASEKYSLLDYVVSNHLLALTFILGSLAIPLLHFPASKEKFSQKHSEWYEWVNELMESYLFRNCCIFPEGKRKRIKKYILNLVIYIIQPSLAKFNIPKPHILTFFLNYELVKDKIKALLCNENIENFHLGLESIDSKTPCNKEDIIADLSKVVDIRELKKGIIKALKPFLIYELRPMYESNKIAKEYIGAAMILCSTAKNFSLKMPLRRLSEHKVIMSVKDEEKILHFIIIGINSKVRDLYIYLLV